MAFVLDFWNKYDIIFLATEYAEVAESADALDSGSSECKFMRVQVPSSAPSKSLETTLFQDFFLVYVRKYVPAFF